MKEQRFCLRLLLQRCILCCVIFSVLFSSLAFETKAAATKVVEDVNKDGELTADEVDLKQLTVYGLTTGYGVLGSDVPDTIVNSDTYSLLLSMIAGEENVVPIGTVADGKITFSDFFKSFCESLYAELTNSSVIGYYVLPSISKTELIKLLNEYNTRVPYSSSDYTNAYNYLTTNDYTGDLVSVKPGQFEIFKQYSDYPATRYPGGYYLYGTSKQITLGFYNGSQWTTYYSDFSCLTCYEGDYVNKSTASPVNKYFDETCSYYVLDGTGVLFNSMADVINFFDFIGPIFYSSMSSKELQDDVSVNTLNSNDWALITSQIYNQVSSAVADANANQVHQIQNIIDNQMNDLSEFIEEDNSEGEDSEGGNEGSEGTGTDNSELSDKLEQNNQLQQESNQLQEENNQLQQESNQLQEEQNETSKGILGKITEFFGGFFENLKNAVVGIFVPDQETMQGNFERLDQFFSNTFGFLYYPFDFLIEAVNIFLSADSGTSLTFPGFSIMGYEVWSDQSFDLTSIDVVNTIFETVRLVTGGVLAFAFINYLRSFFDKRFGGGGA